MLVFFSRNSILTLAPCWTYGSTCQEVILKQKIVFLPFTIIFLVLYLIKEGHEQFQSTHHMINLVWNYHDFQKCYVILVETGILRTQGVK